MFIPQIVKDTYVLGNDSFCTFLQNNIQPNKQEQLSHQIAAPVLIFGILIGYIVHS